MNIKPVYLAVRNVRHILKNHQIISQIVIVNDKLLNIWTIVVVIQFYSCCTRTYLNIAPQIWILNLLLIYR